jgi:hypothetical protein
MASHSPFLGGPGKEMDAMDAPTYATPFSTKLGVAILACSGVGIGVGVGYAAFSEDSSSSSSSLQPPSSRLDPADYAFTGIGTSSTYQFSEGNTLPLLGRPWGFNHWAPQTSDQVGKPNYLQNIILFLVLMII